MPECFRAIKTGLFGHCESVCVLSGTKEDTPQRSLSFNPHQSLCSERPEWEVMSISQLKEEEDEAGNTASIILPKQSPRHGKRPALFM